MDNRKSLLVFPLSCLNIMGSLCKKNLPNIICFIIYFAVGFVLFNFIVLILQFPYYEDNIEHYLRNYDGIAVLAQTLTKWFICVYNKKKLMNLIKYTDHFWNSKTCSHTTKGNIKKISHRVILVQKINTTLYMLATTLGIIVSLYTKELICGYWSMKNQNLFLVVYSTLLINAYPTVLTIVAFDCLFLGICYELIIQCKILCGRLEKLNGQTINHEYNLESYVKQMKKYIKHHILLLRCHSDLQNAYSIIMLVIYITMSPYIIVQSYSLSLTFSINSVKLFTTILAGVIQLSLYCLIASQMTYELSLISDAAYNSAWYSHPSLIVRKSLVLMIQRAQHDATLTGCGLVEFNQETLVKILKFGVSTCIALKKLNSQE